MPETQAIPETPPMDEGTTTRATYLVTLYGTITRDIRRFEVEAESEDEVRRACAEQKPGYRVHSIEPVSLAAALKARNDAFESDDFTWARRQMESAKGAPVDEGVVVLGFHKARYECVQVSEKKRRESQTWLAIGGFKSMTGEPVAIGDRLPE